MNKERKENFLEKEYEYENIINYYDISLNLIEMSLTEVKKLYEIHNNSLGSFILTVIGIKKTKNYLAKQEALERAINFKKNLQNKIDESY